MAFLGEQVLEVFLDWRAVAVFWVLRAWKVKVGFGFCEDVAVECWEGFSGGGVGLWRRGLHQHCVHERGHCGRDQESVFVALRARESGCLYILCGQPGDREIWAGMWSCVPRMPANTMERLLSVHKRESLRNISPVFCHEFDCKMRVVVLLAKLSQMSEALAMETLT